MYLLFLVVALSLSYVGLSFLFSWFFLGKSPVFSKTAHLAILKIGILSILVITGTYLIPHVTLANRLLHAVGGGLMAFYICYLVAKDNKLPITKFQFFVISFLTVTSLGVANELLEGILQNRTSLEFAPTINDTWLDLASNTIGAMMGALWFVPLQKGSHTYEQEKR